MTLGVKTVTVITTQIIQMVLSEILLESGLPNTIFQSSLKFAKIKATIWSVLL